MDYSVTRETLNSGLQLLWMDLPHLHSVAIHAAVRSGPVYESEHNNGVSHLLEHLHMAVARSHPEREEFERTFTELPAYRNANTWPDTIQFEFECSPKAAGELTKLVADTLEVFDFPPDLVASEKRLIESELAAHGTPIELMKRLFKNHPFALPQGGTRRHLRRLSPDELQRFDRASFAANRMVVAIVGRLMPDVLDRAREHLARLPGGQDDALQAPPQPIVRLPIYQPASVWNRQPYVIMGFLIKDSLSPSQAHALTLFDYSHALPSGPLFALLRYGAASTYHFESQLYGLHGTRVYTLTGHTPRRRREAFLETALNLIAAIRDDDSEPAWFETTKRCWQWARERLLDAPAAIAQRIAVGECVVPPEQPISISEELDLLERLSWWDLREFVAEFFTLNRFFLFYEARTRFFDESRLKRLVRSYLA